MIYAANGTLYIAGRSPSKAATALADLRAAHPSSTAKLEFLQLDLADLTSIKPAVEKFLSQEDRLDVLVNNAGVMWPPPGPESVSAQGYEAQIATNVYGPFLLTQLLTPVLRQTAGRKESGEVRVCWAGSIGIELASPPGSVLFETASTGEDLKVKEDVDKILTYGMTKCANVMLGAEGARRDAGSGIVHVVSSTIFVPSLLSIQVLLLNLTCPVFQPRQPHYRAPAAHLLVPKSGSETHSLPRQVRFLY